MHNAIRMFYGRARFGRSLYRHSIYCNGTATGPAVTDPDDGWRRSLRTFSAWISGSDESIEPDEPDGKGRRHNLKGGGRRFKSSTGHFGASIGFGWTPVAGGPVSSQVRQEPPGSGERRITIDTTSDTTQRAMRRNSGQPPAKKTAYLSRFCNVRQRSETDDIGLWLRRSRVRAPSVTLCIPHR